MRGSGSHGPEVARFERKLADYHGVDARNVVCFDSCTSAMAISLRVIGAERVLVPTITWNATANAVELAGCEVVLCPVKSENALMDTTYVEFSDDACDTALGVALYGQSFADVPYAAKQLVVDAAQAFESALVADALSTCFSFHTLKSIGVGVGGAAIFKHEHHASEARLTRFHGVSDDGNVRTQLTHGWKATMPAFAAAIGCALIDDVAERWARRTASLERYGDGVREELKLQRGCPPSSDAAHAFVVWVNDREAFRAALATVAIDTAHYYPALHSQPYWRKDNEGRFIDDVSLGEGLVALPLHSELTPEQVDWVIENVNRVGEPARVRRELSA